jgi:hypothetical protein
MVQRFIFVLMFTGSCLAQDRENAAPAAKNLKVLTPDVNVMRVMQNFTSGLGVQCNYCHVAGDFASDANPKKEVARKMLTMIRQIDMHFPDAGNDFAASRYLPFPEGKQYVTCYTCHQGSVKPATQHPEPVKRAPEPLAPGAQAAGVPGVAPPPSGRAGASVTPDGRTRQ